MKYRGKNEKHELKPRNKHLNDVLRNSRSEAHEPKAGTKQKRSRLKKHFKNSIKEILEGNYID